MSRSKLLQPFLDELLVIGFEHGAVARVALRRSDAFLCAAEDGRRALLDHVRDGGGLLALGEVADLQDAHLHTPGDLLAVEPLLLVGQQIADGTDLTLRRRLAGRVMEETCSISLAEAHMRTG